MDVLPDLLGIVGVACVLGAYWLLQTEKLKQTDRRYYAVNALGAALILVSLVFEFNLPAAIVESAWLLISLHGLLRPRNADESTEKTSPQES